MQSISMNDRINLFNNQLIEADIKLTIKNYIIEINKLTYKIDISFIDKFFKLITKDTCCIPHIYLEDFNVIKVTGNTSANILKLIKKYNFVEDIDYNLLKEEQVRNQRGFVISNKYYFHPDAFKEILMGSCKTNVYCKYYIFLERCIKYYNSYQIKLLKSNKKLLLINLKETNVKLDITNTNLDKLNETNKELIISINN